MLMTSQSIVDGVIMTRHLWRKRLKMSIKETQNCLIKIAWLNQINTVPFPKRKHIHQKSNPLSVMLLLAPPVRRMVDISCDSCINGLAAIDHMYNDKPFISCYDAGTRFKVPISGISQITPCCSRNINDLECISVVYGRCIWSLEGQGHHPVIHECRLFPQFPVLVGFFFSFPF